jgi:hypothetical protein
VHYLNLVFVPVSDNVIIHNTDGTSFMPTLPIHLEWYTDAKGYDLINGDTNIVNRGGELVPTKPLESKDRLFKVFSNLRDVRGLLAFVQRNGLFYQPSYIGPVWSQMSSTMGDPFHSDVDANLGRRDRSSSSEGESVADLLSTAALFQKVMLQSAKGWKRVPRSLDLELSTRFYRKSLGEIGLYGDQRRGFSHTFTTNSLMNGLWLQLAGDVSGGAAFRSCARCGLLFETGPGTDRRADSRFCSDHHRIEFNSRKRTQLR